MKLQHIIIRVLTGIWLAGLISAGAGEKEPARLVLHADQPKDVISRNIYGHFSEHLGRCIYEG